MPMILNFGDFQRVKSLQAGTNVALADAGGVVEISVTGVENRPGDGLVLFEGKLKRLAAGPGIGLVGVDGKITISASFRDVDGDGAALLDERFGTKFLKRLRAGANVSLVEADGAVEISATVARGAVDDLQTDVAALQARLDSLELTPQPMLTNGPMPPGDHVPSLLVPELATADRIEAGCGLILERAEPEGYWKLSA